MAGPGVDVAVAVGAVLHARHRVPAVLLHQDVVGRVDRLDNYRQGVHERPCPLERLVDLVSQVVGHVPEGLDLLLVLYEAAAVVVVVLLNVFRVAEGVVEDGGEQLGEEGVDRVVDADGLPASELLQVKVKVAHRPMMLCPRNAVNLRQ